MHPSNRANSNFKLKDGEQNGSRVYQLMLNSMQVLPVADILKIALLENDIADLASDSQAKRKNSTGNTEPERRRTKRKVDPAKKGTRSSARNTKGSKGDSTMDTA